MYVKIDQTDYTDVRNLVFSPQTDITGESLPINEFSVDIVTDDTIAASQYAELYDDRDRLWAKYWITYAERGSEEAFQIKARSDIALLEGVTLPAVRYASAPIGDVLDATMVRQSGSVGIVATIDYSLSSSFSSATITGCCPEQSARERLQWVCFVLGAYVKSYFNSQIEILPIETTVVSIPIEKEIMRPKVSFLDYVTGVEVTGFSFTSGTPGVGDEYIEINGDDYIITRQTYALANSEAPASAADNVTKFDSVYIVNANNVSGVLANVASYIFNRNTVKMDAIDNGDFIPGMLVQFYADEATIMRGYIQSCAFKFGKQARATLHIIGGVEIETAMLIVKYKFDGRTIDEKTILLPVGYAYSIDNPWFDVEIKGHRYVLRPLTATVTGTMTSGGATATVNYEAALDLYEGTLTISNVDGITTEIEDGKVVGVIE